MRYLDILLAAVAAELLGVLGFDDHRHTLLRLADGELRSVQTAVLHRHAVEVDVQSVGQFADRHAHAACAEVVRLLHQSRRLRAAEQPFELALLRSIALLHLAAARFERLAGVFLRRARGPADPVAARAAAEHQHHIALSGLLAPHVLRFHRPHHGTDFEPLGDIAVVVDFTHVRGSQTDLVAVARIACRGLLRDHALGQLARERLRHRLIDIARTRYAHGLIDIGAARQRIADRAAQTGRRAAERFDFRGVVVGFVLELQQPPLGTAVDLHVDIDRASVVLVAHLQIVQQPPLAQKAGADRGQIHQAEALMLAAQLAADREVQSERILDLVLCERLLDGDLLQFGRKGRVAAMVAPVGIQNAQLRLVGIAAFAAEITDHLGEVVGIHRQALRFAVVRQVGLLHPSEPVEHRHGLHRGLLRVVQHREVLFAGLDGIDVVTADAAERLVRQIAVENEQLRRFDPHVGLRVDQPHAIHGRSGPLIELAGQTLHGQIPRARKIALVRNAIGYDLAEDGITALLKQLLRETEEVVDIHETQRAQAEIEVVVQLAAQAFGLDLKTG